MLDKEEQFEKLIVSLIKMVGKSNEKVDDLMRRVRQLELASKEQQYNRIYSFISEPHQPTTAAGKTGYTHHS